MGALLLGIGQASTILLLVLTNWIAFQSCSTAALATRQLATNATANSNSASADLNTADFPPGIYLGWGIDATQLGFVDGSNVCRNSSRRDLMPRCQPANMVPPDPGEAGQL